MEQYDDAFSRSCEPIVGQGVPNRAVAYVSPNIFEVCDAMPAETAGVLKLAEDLGHPLERSKTESGRLPLLYIRSATAFSACESGQSTSVL